jgi:hypothetical protein
MLTACLVQRIDRMAPPASRLASSGPADIVRVQRHKIAMRRPHVRPRRPDLEPALGFGRMIGPRTPPLLLQAPMRLRPSRRFLCILIPMDQAPRRTTPAAGCHNTAVRPRLHEGVHGSFITPHSAGPECAIGVAKDRNRQASSRTLGLARLATSLDQKGQHLSPRPNPWKESRRYRFGLAS